MSKIEGQRPPDALIPGLHSPPPLEQTQKTPQQVATNVGKDAVDVSSRAKILSRIAAAVNAVPDIRSETVSVLKQSIDAGTYDVSSEDVADALIRDRLRDAVR